MTSHSRCKIPTHQPLFKLATISNSNRNRLELTAAIDPDRNLRVELGQADVCHELRIVVDSLVIVLKNNIANPQI